jgi:hypothetical protein
LGGTIAGPSRLLDLSRGLKVNEDTKVATAVNLSTGEGQIQFEASHKDEAGAPLRVPNIFLLGVPVFEGGPCYRLPVRLRYRVSQGTVRWIVQRYRPELTSTDAFTEACQVVRDKTGLPVLLGTPEC